MAETLHMTETQTTVTYYDIFPPDYSVTGIRAENTNDTQVLMTGSFQSGGLPQGLVYRGSLPPSGPGEFILDLKPPGAVSSVFYGPNTARFNPSIGEGKLRVVGSCKYASGGADHGVMFEGSPNGSGPWTIIDMSRDVAGGEVANTILHSTMGNLIVGNYDLKGSEAGKFNAFVYNMVTRGYQKLNLRLPSGVLARLVTAYGIWQNGGDGSTFYTIAGGLFDADGVNVAFLVDYDSSTGNTTNLKTFADGPGPITHFEGITAVAGYNGYLLAAEGDQSAAMADVRRIGSSSGPFDNARWEKIYDPKSSGICTGNTVLTNNVFGIYQPNTGGFQSYKAVVT